MIKFDVQG
jgi:hypothetical protein